NPSLGTALIALVLGLQALSVAPAAAGDPYEAKPFVNRNYVSPYGPEGPWAHIPACQVIVRVAHTVGAVTGDDLFYCRLAALASWRPSDPCACFLSDGSVRRRKPGMVVWKPAWWSPVVWLDPYPYPSAASSSQTARGALSPKPLAIAAAQLRLDLSPAV